MEDAALLLPPLVDRISSLDTLWVLIAAALVFFMQAGFALLEAGFTQSKNSVNLIMKNVLDMSFGTIAFLLVGFGLMFGAGNAWLGQEFFLMMEVPEAWGTIPTSVFFLFQAVFAATAATIVSGAVAERTRFLAYLLFSMVLTAFIYPVVGHWIWQEGGWLAQMGFQDFAGSTVVHVVGGAAALAGVLVVGPRVGRFNRAYDQKRFTGHSIPLAALGVFILWLGWFGFNPGSLLAVEGSDNAGLLGRIALNTQLSAAAGAASATFVGWVFTRFAKVGLALNGALGGLVAITAGCAYVTPFAALLIGIVGGVVVFILNEVLFRCEVDDAVGAIPVHLGCGVWGTIAVGLFSLERGLFWGEGAELFWVQVLGTLISAVFVFVLSYAVFRLIGLFVRVGATETEQELGLDLKHGQSAYHDYRY